MKQSKIILSATAFILAIAGAYATKTNKSHERTIGTKGIGAHGDCVKHSAVFASTLVNATHTLKTQSVTAFTWNNGSCNKTLFTTGD